MRFEEAFQFIPSPNGTPAILPAEFGPVWAQHLKDCGFVHVDDVRALAVDGVVDVERLPRQRIKLAPALRGPRNGFNASARWVSVMEPDPEPMRIPDIRELTAQENAAMLEQYREAGLIPDSAPAPVMAAEA